jgi:hypothetical protein
MAPCSISPHSALSVVCTPDQKVDDVDCSVCIQVAGSILAAVIRSVVARYSASMTTAVP